MNLLELTTKIKKIEIKVKLLNHLLPNNGSIMNVDKIHGIIKEDFSTDCSFEEKAQRILNALQPHCYEVQITPPTVGFNYKYTILVRK